MQHSQDFLCSTNARKLSYLYILEHVITLTFYISLTLHTEIITKQCPEDKVLFRSQFAQRLVYELPDGSQTFRFTEKQIDMTIAQRR